MFVEGQLRGVPDISGAVAAVGLSFAWFNFFFNLNMLDSQIRIIIFTFLIHSILLGLK